MMRKSVKISLKNVHTRQISGLFYNDPASNFYLLLQQKLYSLRKQLLSLSPYFAKFIRKNHKVHVIDKNFDRIAFQKILGLFYGIECQLEKEEQIIKVLDIIKFLQLQELQKLIKHKLWQNFDDYELFFLLEISYKINDEQLLSRCQEQLISFQFEQINFGRFQLMKCSQQVFKNIIKLHQKLKLSGKIKGLKFQSLRTIIDNFNRTNSTKVDIITALAPPTSAIIVEDSDEQIQDQQTTKFGLRRCVTIYQSVDRNDFLTSTGFQIVRQKSFQDTNSNVSLKNQSKPNISNFQKQKTATLQESKSCSIQKRCNPASSPMRKFLKYQHKIMFQKLYSAQSEETTSPKSQAFEDDLLTSDVQKLSLKKSLKFKRKKSQEISTSSFEIQSKISEYSLIQEIQNTGKRKNQQTKLFKSQGFKRKQ